MSWYVELAISLCLLLIIDHSIRLRFLRRLGGLALVIMGFLPIYGALEYRVETDITWLPGTFILTGILMFFSPGQFEKDEDAGASDK